MDLPGRIISPQTIPRWRNKVRKPSFDINDFGRSTAVSFAFHSEGAVTETQGWTSVVEVRRLRRPCSVAEERDGPIYVARDQRMTLQQLWPCLAEGR